MSTISKEAKAALIEALNGIEFHGDEGFDDAISYACETVESFPTSDDGWIPVTERMPDDRFVIGNVITRNGDVVMEVNYRDNGRFYDHEDCLLKVSHWQPLPTQPVTERP